MPTLGIIQLQDDIIMFLDWHKRISYANFLGLSLRHLGFLLYVCISLGSQPLATQKTYQCRLMYQVPYLSLERPPRTPCCHRHLSAPLFWTELDVCVVFCQEICSDRHSLEFLRTPRCPAFNLSLSSISPGIFTPFGSCSPKSATMISACLLPSFLTQPTTP